MRTVCRSHNHTYLPVGTTLISLFCGSRDRRRLPSSTEEAAEVPTILSGNGRPCARRIPPAGGRQRPLAYRRLRQPTRGAGGAPEGTAWIAWRLVPPE